MILNHLSLNLWAHAIERIVSTLQFTSKAVKSLDDFALDISTGLVIVDTWSEWISVQVSSNSDSCTPNHSCLIRWEVWSIKSIIWVFLWMEIIRCIMSMILIDDWVENI